MKRNIVKSMLSILLIVTLLAAPMSALAASKAYVLRVSVSDFANVRSESGEQIAQLRKGTRVLYWGEKNDQMLKVMTASGDVGYVYQGNFTSYGAMSTKQLYVTASERTGVYGRRGNSPVYRGSVGKGVPVVVYQVRGNWAYVRNLSGKTAYIRTSDLSKLN